MGLLLRIDKNGNLAFGDNVVNLSEVIVRKIDGTLQDIKGNIIDISNMYNSDFVNQNLVNTVVMRSLTSDNAAKLGGNLPEYFLNRNNYKDIIKDIVPITPTPIVTNISNVVSRTSVDITISNFDSVANYTFAANKGTIAYTTGNTFTYTAPNVTVVTTDTITVLATKESELRSAASTLNIHLLPLNIKADAGLLNANFRINSNYNSGFRF